jgi:mRNA interferase HicA
MKRKDLIRHLIRHGCQFLREGGGHSIYHNPATGQTASVPRHLEIDNFTAREICDQLGIPRP